MFRQHRVCLTLFLAVWLPRIQTQTTPYTTSASSSTTSPPTPVLYLTDEARYVVWIPKSNQSVIIEAEDGYKLAVTINECNINGMNKEYASIRSGEEDKGLMFTYKVAGKPSYLFNTNKLFANYISNEASNFTANFSRVGEQLTTTTTEMTTTTQFLPTPSANESAEISVYVGGKRAMDYKNAETLNSFRDAVRKMATEYCANENFDLVDEITINNVNVSEILPCPNNWPGYENCALITFSVPVHQNETSVSRWKGYQLNSQHLRIVWDRYHAKYLDGGMGDFVIPNMTKWIIWQIVVFTLTSLSFVVCLSVWRFFSEDKKSNNLDDKELIISPSNRNSESSLNPHFLQSHGAFYENVKPMYNPGSMGPPLLKSLENVPDETIRPESPMKLEITENLGESGA